MSSSEAYRHHAGSCLGLAEKVSDPRIKAAMLEMARAWHNLADQAERNSKADLVYETPNPV
jgi:hypothetical protein